MDQAKVNFWTKTQNFLATLRHSNASQIINFKSELEAIQAETSYTFIALTQANNKSLKKLRKAISKDAEHLIGTAPEVSLRILSLARRHGVNSLKSESIRAKILASLNHHQEAMAIWKEQASCNQKSIQNEANYEITNHTRKVELFQDLLGQLRAKLNLEKVKIKHLPEQAPQDISTLEYFIVNEAIALRAEKNERLSLEILDMCIDSGINTDLVNENRARAMFNMGQKRDAIQIWQSLLKSEDSAKQESSRLILDRFGRDLLAKLKKNITNAGLPIQHLPEYIPQDLSILGRSILREAIELRQSQHEALSFKILELTTSAGFETDAINENKARALLNLQRNSEAVQILQSLLSSKNPATQSSAKKILQGLNNKLLSRLRDIIIKNGKEIRHLPEKSDDYLAGLEKVIIREAISLRKDKQEKLSLQLLELSIKTGLKTDLIEDNIARTLVNMDKYGEAVTIWQSLKDSKNPKIRDSATLMLNRFWEQGMQQNTLKEVDSLLLETDHYANGREKAINLLTSAILKNPNDEILQNKLGEIASSNSNDIDNDIKPEDITRHQQNLDGFYAFLKALENLQQPALKGEATTPNHHESELINPEVNSIGE